MRPAHRCRTNATSAPCCPLKELEKEKVTAQRLCRDARVRDRPGFNRGAAMTLKVKDPYE